jgi:SM-20-related protein
MRTLKKINLNGRKIIVIDSFLSKSDQKLIAVYLSQEMFTRTETDSKKTRHIQQWVAEKLKKKLVVYLNSKFGAVLKEHFPEQQLKLYRSYCNSISYGDVNFPHRDCLSNEDDVTVLLYANQKWERNWGGETIFYDDAEEVEAAVLPKPGRVVLFHGALEHRAGVPNRECYDARLSIAFKYSSRGI